MDEKEMKTLLERAAERDVPDPADLWPVLERQLLQATHRPIQPLYRRLATQVIGGAVFAAVLLLIAVWVSFLSLETTAPATATVIAAAPSPIAGTRPADESVTELAQLANAVQSGPATIMIDDVSLTGEETVVSGRWEMVGGTVLRTLHPPTLITGEQQFGASAFSSALDDHTFTYRFPALPAGIDALTIAFPSLVVSVDQSVSFTLDLAMLRDARFLHNEVVVRAGDYEMAFMAISTSPDGGTILHYRPGNSPLSARFFLTGDEPGAEIRDDLGNVYHSMGTNVVDKELHDLTIVHEAELHLAEPLAAEATSLHIRLPTMRRYTDPVSALVRLEGDEGGEVAPLAATSWYPHHQHAVYIAPADDLLVPPASLRRAGIRVVASIEEMERLDAEREVEIVYFHPKRFAETDRAYLQSLNERNKMIVVLNTPASETKPIVPATGLKEWPGEWLREPYVTVLIYHREVAQGRLGSRSISTMIVTQDEFSLIPPFIETNWAMQRQETDANEILERLEALVEQDAAFTRDYRGWLYRRSEVAEDELLREGVLAAPHAPLEIVEEWIYLDGEGHSEQTLTMVRDEDGELLRQVAVADGQMFNPLYEVQGIEPPPPTQEKVEFMPNSVATVEFLRDLAIVCQLSAYEQGQQYHVVADCPDDTIVSRFEEPIFTTYRRFIFDATSGIWLEGRWQAVTEARRTVELQRTTVLERDLVPELPMVEAAAFEVLTGVPPMAAGSSE